MAKSRSRSARQGPNRFWARLKEIAVPADLTWESGDCMDPEFRDIYEAHFDGVEKKLQHLQKYALQDPEGRALGKRPQVLYLMDVSENGFAIRIDGMLMKGKGYYDKFINASEVDAAVMWNYDDLEYITFIDPAFKDFY